MDHVFVTAPEPRLIAMIAQELLGDGMAAERIQVFSARPEQGSKLPVQVLRYRPPASAMMVGGLVGAAVGVLVGMPLLMLGAFAIAPVLVIAVLGAVGGAVYRLWFGQSLGGELYRLNDVLRRGASVMVIEVETTRIGELEHRVKTRHPQVSVLGTDVGGTPPFP
jgi:hypothetical protein